MKTGVDRLHRTFYLGGMGGRGWGTELSHSLSPLSIVAASFFARTLESRHNFDPPAGGTGIPPTAGGADGGAAERIKEAESFLPSMTICTFRTAAAVVDWSGRASSTCVP